MTKQQIAHMNKLNEMFVKMNTEKYKKGQKEHGGNLFDLTPLQLLEEARSEFIDGFVYVQTAIDQLEDEISISVKKGSKMDKLLREMLDDDSWIEDKNTTDKSAPK